MAEMDYADLKIRVSYEDFDDVESVAHFLEYVVEMARREFRARVRNRDLPPEAVLEDPEYDY